MSKRFISSVNIYWLFTMNIENILLWFQSQNITKVFEKYIQEISEIVQPIDPIGVVPIHNFKNIYDTLLPFRILYNFRPELNFDYDRKKSSFQIPPEDYQDMPYVDTKEKYKYIMHIFSPKNNKKKLPVLLNFHTGGWVNFPPMDFLLDADLHVKNWKTSPYIVIDIGYPLAPEFKFPIGHEACYHATTEWISKYADKYNLDTEKIILFGPSSGGHIATCVTKMWLQRGCPKVKIIGQILENPVIAPRFDSFSFNAYRNVTSYMHEYSNGIYRIWDKLLYYPIKDQSHKNLNQLDQDFKFPQTLMLVCGEDMYRGEQIEYEQHLLKNGTNVVVKFYPKRGHATVSTKFGSSDDLNWKQAYTDFILDVIDCKTYRDQNKIKPEYRFLELIFNWPFTGVTIDI